MDLPFEDAIKELMAEFEKTKRDIAKAQKGMTEVSATARSKSRMLSVTVNGRGDVTDLKFHSQSWRNMAPGELSKVILQTIKDARAKSHKEMWSAMQEFAPPGVDLSTAISGELDWAAALSGDAEVPGIVRDYLAKALPTPPANS